MSTTRRSLIIYAALMAYLVLDKIAIDLLGVHGVVAEQNELFAPSILAITTLGGGLAVWLGPRIELPALWDESVRARNRLLFPVLIGLGIGAVSLTMQVVTGLHELLAEAAHAPTVNIAFPGSLLFYSGGAIILEAFYRLILITLPVWLIANLILRKRGQSAVFWVVAVLASAHEPYEQASFLAGHTGLMVISGVTTFGTNVFEMWLLRRNGWLAPLSFRLGLYAVQHVVGSVLGL